MSKIEKPQAVTRLDEIMEISDSLMVARGDLGVELPLEKVPGIQKQITRAGAPRRQAGHRRDPDAGIDDHQPGADARGSLRRRDRDFRGRRRHHAVGGIRGRAISGRSNRNHGPHRAGSGIRSDLSHHHRRPARRAGSHRRRRHCRRDPPDRRDARSLRHHLLDEFGLDGSSASRASARSRRLSRSRRTFRPGGNYRWSGACIAWSPKTRTTRTTWWSAPAASRSRTASRKPDAASSSSRAFRSERRARPTWCASPLSDRISPSHTH